MDHKETCEKVLARRNFEGARPPSAGDHVRPPKRTGPATSKGQAGFMQTIHQEPRLGKIHSGSD